MSASGRMLWDSAVDGPLRGATCLWQDLDGLHVGPPPSSVPLTSILWGWKDDGTLVRVRLDGNEALVAVHPAGSAPGDQVLPWSTDGKTDGRAASLRVAPGCDVSAETAFAQVVVPGPGEGTGAITFLRPAGAA